MTTQARPEHAEHDGKRRSREIAAAHRRNRIFWQEHAAELRERHPTGRLLIVEGGTVLAFDDSQAYFDHLAALDDFQRATVFRVLPPRMPGTLLNTNSFLPKRP